MLQKCPSSLSVILTVKFYLALMKVPETVILVKKSTKTAAVSLSRFYFVVWGLPDLPK